MAYCLFCSHRQGKCRIIFNRKLGDKIQWIGKKIWNFCMSKCCLWGGYHCVKVPMSWRLSTHRWHLLVPDPQMSCNDSISISGHHDISTNNGHQGLALLTLSWDKNWDSHSLVNGYPSFYPRIALVAPSPGWYSPFYCLLTIYFASISVHRFALTRAKNHK